MLSNGVAQPGDPGAIYEVILAVRAAFHRLAGNAKEDEDAS